MPVITARYPTTGETAIMGDSLAGLFVVETLFTDPDMFDTYIAIDPSVWWNNADLVTRSGPLLPATASRQKILYLASSSDDTPEFTRKLAERLQKESSATLKCWFEPMKQEKHATIYHPAASLAVRKLFAPSPR
jgi:predicted alpha/beta superfamily hydrolase